MLAGHDYAAMYPKVKEEVDKFVRSEGLRLQLIRPADKKLRPEAKWDCCTSWFVVKP